MALTSEQIVAQSKTALRQWGPQWREHASYISKYKMKPLSDFEATGVGKACLVVANGYSLELEIETIKKHQHNVDILVCDKALGHLLNNGITPTYVIVCDANVNYDKYLKPYENQLQNTILFANVCANPKWADNGNWKDRYFFTNKDAIQSEKQFQELSGCKNEIAAGTNVSNCMIIFLTQCDNDKRQNFFGYDKMLTIGFDYCWVYGGNYYAFDEDGGGKADYMTHIYGRTIAGDLCYTSNNLSFSLNWLTQYVNVFKLPVVQCTKNSVFVTKNMGKLSEQMQYRYKPEDSELMRSAVNKRLALQRDLVKIDQVIKNVQVDHHYTMVGSCS